MKRVLSFILMATLLAAVVLSSGCKQQENSLSSGGTQAGNQALKETDEKYFQWYETTILDFTEEGKQLKEVVIPAKATKIQMGMITRSEKMELLAFAGSTIEFFPMGSEFTDNTTIKEVRLPSGLTEIPTSYLFFNCVSLEKVVLPDALKTIPKGTFSGCISLKEIDLKNVENIEEGAFSRCEGLTEITIPTSVKTIGQEAFRQCKSLSSINFEGGETIGLRAFYLCLSLTRVELPETLISIDNAAFASCESLKEAKLPGSLETIGGSIFEFSPVEKIEVKEGSPAAEAFYTWFPQNIEIVTY